MRPRIGDSNVMRTWRVFGPLRVPARRMSIGRRQDQGVCGCSAMTWLGLPVVTLAR